MQKTQNSKPKTKKQSLKIFKQCKSLLIVFYTNDLQYLLYLMNYMNKQNYDKCKVLINYNGNIDVAKPSIAKLQTSFTNNDVDIKYSNTETLLDIYHNIRDLSYDSTVLIEDKIILNDHFASNLVNKFNSLKADCVLYYPKYFTQNQDIIETQNTRKIIQNRASNIIMFNKKCLDILINYIDNHRDEQKYYVEDVLSGHKLTQKVCCIDSFIYSDSNQGLEVLNSQEEYPDHQNETSTIDNEYCDISLFNHKYWSSYIYLNKRNMRLYQINHDDHGSFELLNDGNTVKINWDNWGIEIFHKEDMGGYHVYNLD